MLCKLFAEKLIGLQHTKRINYLIYSRYKTTGYTKPDFTHCCAKSGLSVMLTNSFFKHGFFF